MTPHDTPFFIAIAGASCSGKSTLAQTLSARLPESAVIPLDAYYRGLGHLPLPERARFNFDAPNAIEHELLGKHLRALKRGQSVEIPVYDYTTHTRAASTHTIVPVPWIVIEGVLALYWQSIRKKAGLKVFLETPPGLCLERRIARDTRERGRSEPSIRQQYAATVQPMFERYCAPTARFADLTLPGDGTVDDAVEKIVAFLEHRVHTWKMNAAKLGPCGPV